jgi:hypothetical protein
VSQSDVFVSSFLLVSETENSFARALFSLPDYTVCNWKLWL